jgi:molecular chaperone GrpE
MGRKKNHQVDGGALPELEEEPEEREVRVTDKRRFARMLGFGPEPEPGAVEEVEEEPETEAPRVPAYVEELQRRVEAAEARSRAEVEAARTRLERHFETRLESARADLAASLLEVYDNLERALETPGAPESPLYEGILATRDIFLRKLAELGVEPIAAAGEPFDPELHEAIDQVPVDDADADGRVVAEYQRGFRLGDRLVRPARVRVGRHA